MSSDGDLDAGAAADRHRAHARVLMELGRLEQAAEALRAGLAAEPDHAEMHAELANCLLELGEHDEAEREVGRALHLAPDDDFAHYVRFELARARADYPAAEKAIAEAIALDPTNAQYHCSRAELFAELERWDAAFAAAREALALDPDDPEALILRTIVMVHLGQADLAADEARRALALDPVDARSHAVLGAARLAAGAHREAFDCFREAQRLEPDKDWVRGFALIALGLAGKPLTAAAIAWAIDKPRWPEVRPGLLGALLGPLGLLATLARASVGGLVTLLLRATRYGRLAVARPEAAVSTWFALLWLAVPAAIITGALAGGLRGAGAALTLSLLVAAPVGVALSHPPGRQRWTAAVRTSIGGAAGCALWLLVALLIAQ